VSAIWPSTYAAATSVFVEVRKRLGSKWLRQLLAKDGGPSILDAGGGGVGVLAWKEIIRAEWETMQHNRARPPPTPPGKSTVLTGADNLRYRAASLLENTTFLPRLPDYVHVRDSATLVDDRPASQRKQFDVIIAPHTLWPLGEEWERRQQVQNLWSLLNPDHGVLILIEKGVPRGFEVIAGARQFLLNQFIATPGSSTSESEHEISSDSGALQKGKGMIIAPCTNHAPCPMYPVPGVSRGRKDYCSFQQRFIRPPFLQRILGARERNHDDVDFSYVAVQKGRSLKAKMPLIQPLRDMRKVQVGLRQPRSTRWHSLVLFSRHSNDLVT
jgi:ribosomal protein RSM22 (predicted rRNA methylase)